MSITNLHFPLFIVNLNYLKYKFLVFKKYKNINMYIINITTIKICYVPTCVYLFLKTHQTKKVNNILFLFKTQISMKVHYSCFTAHICIYIMTFWC